jgi:histidyl-tRNA synthetase
MSEKLQAVRGMNDVLPEDAARWEYLEDVLRDWLRSYGYRNVRTPLVEHTRLFHRAIGGATDIVEKEMYSFEDSLNGEHLSLRPESTAPTVRMAIEHNLLHSGGQRLYYFGPMFRHERPQKGRYRQFHQVGVEALGFSGPDVDAELLLMCQRLWDLLGLTGMRLELNSLGSPVERAAHRTALIDYFNARKALLDEDSTRRLGLNPLRILDSKNPAMQPLIEDAPKLTEYLGADSLSHFSEVQAILGDAGIAFRVNPRLVRGLDYYNLTVFEWVTDKLGAQGTVCGGGRYDGLFEQLGGKSTPACGWAMGMERLLALLEAEGHATRSVEPGVYLVSQGDVARRYAFKVSEALRSCGVSVIQHCGGGSFKSQMKKADGSGARLAVIIGDDEASRDEVTVKDLRIGGEQLRLRLEVAAEAVRGILHQ